MVLNWAPYYQIRILKDARQSSNDQSKRRRPSAHCPGWDQRNYLIRHWKPARLAEWA